MILSRINYRPLTVLASLVLVAAPFGGVTFGETIDLGVAFDVSGKVGDMRDRTSSSGVTFEIGLRNIDYHGRVARVVLEYKEPGRGTVWLGIRDLTVTIQRTEINSRWQGARCGPLKVVLGNRRQLWLAFDVEQQHQEQTKLVIQNTRFAIAGDNWQVGSPSWVNCWGIGMTDGKVVKGLRSGLAGKKKIFEQKILDVAPTMFSQVRDDINWNLNQDRLALK